MSDPFPEARRRLQLDHTDHARIISENRAALLRDECDRLKREIRTLEEAADVLPYVQEIGREIAAKRDTLERKQAERARCLGRR